MEELLDNDPKKPTTHEFDIKYPINHRLLKLTEEQDLCRRAQRGDIESRDKMVAHNIKLVISIAKRYKGRSMVMEDLIQEGILGLYRAVEKYDPSKGFRFSTYASYWIRQAVIRAIERHDRIIRIPSHVIHSERRITKVEQ